MQEIVLRTSAGECFLLQLASPPTPPRLSHFASLDHAALLTTHSHSPTQYDVPSITSISRSGALVIRSWDQLRANGQASRVEH